MTRTGLVTAQREVDGKTNEITALEPLLAQLALEGAVVTFDALHSQTGHARFLVEEDHGRDETRRTNAAAVTGIAFPHAVQALQIVRRRQVVTTSKVTLERVYGVADLTAEQADATEIARRVRYHCGIEDKIHHVGEPRTLRTPFAYAPALPRHHPAADHPRHHVIKPAVTLPPAGPRRNRFHPADLRRDKDGKPFRFTWPVPVMIHQTRNNRRDVAGSVDDGHPDRLVGVLRMNLAERVEQPLVAPTGHRLLHRTVGHHLRPQRRRQIVDCQVLIEESARTAQREYQAHHGSRDHEEQVRPPRQRLQVRDRLRRCHIRVDDRHGLRKQQLIALLLQAVAPTPWGEPVSKREGAHSDRIPSDSLHHYEVAFPEPDADLGVERRRSHMQHREDHEFK
ncbi:transposase [Streptomyces sp. RB17]|uniref:transposase n=1 Tax=Streptomyces sp. RB17 TaxID=2585197 RepID=UPI002B201DD3|nr:transposase [Streptomyces sp. RB17]